jgi:hypothetical protein
MFIYSAKRRYVKVLLHYLLNNKAFLHFCVAVYVIRKYIFSCLISSIAMKKDQMDMAISCWNMGHVEEKWRIMDDAFIK